ncbi:MAG: asparagine synthase (glutamine-hydrolyzing) [Elusimicrobia bacterium]|nr:asparagine synthase (glutamine-hydrolyzing) [Elusimicrobiota bacterium]
MCGICGVVYDEPGRVDRALLRKANDLLLHRGPDDEGSYVDEYAGLAMRRLSIIDLSTGHQPISNREESLHIVFNGEVYNFQELRSPLEAAGYPFKTKTDTEVVLALYEREGPACVSRLRGMFAFAVWDSRKRRLFLARDRVGKKPLLYALGPGFLAFASELRSLLCWPVDRRLNAKAVDYFLSLQYIPSPHTIYAGVHKLPPAHTLLFERGKATVERYWDLPVGRPPLKCGVPEACEMLREKLKEAVRLRLISDVPLGAFLSGGVDSSIIVALMSELSAQPVKTFSIGFKEERFSELPYAREVAKACGTDHREFIVTAEMTDVLPKLAWHYGEPYADASALPSYYVSRETRRFVTVALNGDGGDENFAGYIRYFAMKAARLYDAVPAPLRRATQAAAELLPDQEAPFAFFWKLKRFLRSAVFADIARRHLKMICYFSEEDKKGLYAPGMLHAAGLEAGRERADAEHYLNNAFIRAQGEDFVNSMLYVDFVTYLPECLMVKMDIAAMANSLEGRSPFLDHEFMELAFRMPGDWKLKGLRGHKWILKKAFKRKLPPMIQRRGKMGFGIPVGAWFRGKLKDYWRDHVLSPEALSRGYFNREALEAIFDQHQSRRRDHGYRMWALLMLELWHRQYEPGFKGFS